LWIRHRLDGGTSRFVMHFHGNPKIESSGSRRARFAFLFFDRVLQNMQKILAVSPGLARYIEDRTGRPGLVQYLPNPVRQFTDVKRADHQGTPVSFVSIGRLARQKGFDILIQAFAKVLAGGTGARLTIVGSGDQFQALTDLTVRLGISKWVKLTGTIPNPAAELAEADCFVSASRWEGFGVAIVEAMSAGLYVIASDCEFGPSDLVDRPEIGTIVPSEDVDALALAMNNFACSDRSRGDADRIRRDAAAVFSLDHVVAQHAAMLEAVGA
jgi:glycosyltransferase involved in cell wall biosynthesis